MKREINYTFWGESIDSNWYEWFLAVKDLFEKCGYKVTHYGINSESYNPDKAVTASRKEKAIVELLKSGEVPNSIEFYSVSKDFVTVSGDAALYCLREKNCICVIVRESAVPDINEDAIMEMKKYIKFESGEVFSARILNSIFYSHSKTHDKFHEYEFIKNIE